LLWDLISKNFWITSKIICLVTVLLVLIEYLELRYKDRIREKLTGNALNQYLFASLLGAVPGCLDAFLVVSLYIHGMVGFGALVAVMLSTAGDEAFIMLALIPNDALKIFLILILLGFIGGFIADWVTRVLDVKTCEHCVIEVHEEYTGMHFLREHVYEHVIKKHVPRLFFWIFVPLVLVELLIQSFNLADIISTLPVSTLIVFAALVGVIPESGPHLIFLILYSKGLIPFSVLLVSTLSQDGHGLLPLLSHSLKDTVYVQLFTTGFSLIVGLILLAFGF
jgi:hypothetical protein